MQPAPDHPSLFSIFVMIFGVLFSCAVMGWMALRAGTSVERAENEPRYRRRLLLVAGAIYTLGGISLIVDVAVGSAPLWNLCFLPIPILFVGTYFKQQTESNILLHKTQIDAFALNAPFRQYPSAHGICVAYEISRRCGRSPASNYSPTTGHVLLSAPTQVESTVPPALHSSHAASRVHLPGRCRTPHH